MSVLLNILLFIIKFIAGKISGSVSIMADAFNNLTDAGTALFSACGIWISSIGPGKNHPDGHGKFEWVFALITSFSVLLVGWELLRDSIESIKDPQNTAFSWITVLILIISIGTKLFLYLFNLKKSKKNNLLSLRAVAMDSLADAISTSAVLISLLINVLLGWKIDGYFGLAVSFLIMFNAVKSASESISSIVGTSASEEEMRELHDAIAGLFENDIDIVDLKLSDDGYNRHTASFHLVSSDQISSEELLCSVPLIQKQLLDIYHYNSIIQIEKAADQTISNMIIEKAKENLIKVNCEYQIKDARVLICKNKTYQLSAIIMLPLKERKSLDTFYKMISNPDFFGLRPEDSVFIKVMFKGHKKRSE